MKCNYYDCGWCYAPESIDNNSRGGACYAPTKCPYQNKKMNYYAPTSLQVSDWGNDFIFAALGNKSINLFIAEKAAEWGATQQYTQSKEWWACQLNCTEQEYLLDHYTMKPRSAKQIAIDLIHRRKESDYALSTAEWNIILTGLEEK